MSKLFQKDSVGSLTPFLFDVLAQLANILARITLYEHLKLPKSTRDALKEALADAKIFIIQIPAICEEETTTIATIPRNSFPTSPSP